MMDKGYKLHTVWSNGPLPEVWEATSLKVGETTVAGERLGRLRGRGGYLLADGNYDSSPLFDEAGEAGYEMVVPIGHANAGQGHCYQSPWRMRCVERMRTGTERKFNNATSFGGGGASVPGSGPSSSSMRSES